MAVNMRVPNSIIFVSDSNLNEVEYPEYVVGELASSNESCISIGTKAEVDGPVTIRFSPVEDSDSSHEIYRGFVSTPSKKMVVSTSLEDNVLETEVPGNHSEISVWVNDLKFPSLIEIELHLE